MAKTTEFVRDPGGDTRPVPDPTALTTYMIDQRVVCLREIIESRLNGMDLRFNQLHAEFDRVPAGVAKDIEHLEDLHAEKFHSIDTQFKERDVRTEQTAKDSKVAVDAALQAAKELVAQQNASNSLAISKSETATAKQIDQMATAINTTTNGLNDKVADIKSQMGVLKDDIMGEIRTLREGVSRGSGAENQAAIGKSDSQFNTTAIIASLALFVAVVGVVIGIVLHFTGKS